LRISGASGGDPHGLSEIGVSAAAHGGQLLQLGFTVDAVVHDYGDLCQAITDLGVELAGRDARRVDVASARRDRACRRHLPGLRVYRRRGTVGQLSRRGPRLCFHDIARRSVPWHRGRPFAASWRPGESAPERLQVHAFRHGSRADDARRGKPDPHRAHVADASKFTVKGCRTIKGNYRGVSVFDTTSARLRNAEWFVIPVDTEIPPGLAVTKDGDKRPGVPLHYTIAPKDDMPFTLFLQHLKGLEAKLKKHNAGQGNARDFN